MSYEVFCKQVSDIVRRTGANAKFFKEDGKHVAHCTDGVTIIGNSECPNVLVKWGSGHMAIATI